MAGVYLSKGKNMNRLVRVALLALLCASVAQAQDDRALSSQSNGNVAEDFANTSAVSAKFSDNFFAPKAERPFVNALLLAAEPAASAPAEPVPAAPDPKFMYGSRDDFRWQLALGVTLVRFRSPVFYATGVGTNTAVTYFTNEWFGVEGSVNTAFAPTIYQNEHVKYLSYGGGPKVAWRARKWEPWVHGIFGGVHVQPKTVFGTNGFCLQVGGGVDYRIYPHLSARLETDWVKTHLYGQWENSAQVNADIVLHF
jgi:opacity protein-like surface antigen